jgi:hypothetical protein
MMGAATTQSKTALMPKASACLRIPLTAFHAGHVNARSAVSVLAMSVTSF